MLNTTQIEEVTKVYNLVAKKFTPDQVSVLSTMLYRITQENETKEIIEREKIKLDSYEKRTAWVKEKAGYKPPASKPAPNPQPSQAPITIKKDDDFPF